MLRGLSFSPKKLSAFWQVCLKQKQPSPRRAAVSKKTVNIELGEEALVVLLEGRAREAVFLLMFTPCQGYKGFQLLPLLIAGSP